MCNSLFFVFILPSETQKVEQSENSLSSEQVSLLLQKVFTKDRLKAILLQEEEEDKTKVQSLEQDLEGKDTGMLVKIATFSVCCIRMFSFMLLHLSNMNKNYCCYILIQDIYLL